MKSMLKAWLIAACAVAGVGCSDGDKTQVLTGRLTNRDAIAVRAIDGATIVTAARVRSDGSFTLLLPANHRYRLEVLTKGGVHNVVGTKYGALADITFKVCEPQDAFDMGGMNEPKCDPMDPSCGDGGTCDPMSDPNCMPPCDPTTDPMCKGDPLPPCDPMTDPMCEPQPCDPNDPSCVVCADGTEDPNCKCEWWMGTDCEPVPPCDPTVDAMCPTPPTPCEDPTDPNTCKDPCMVDPLSCGCGTDPGDPNGMTGDDKSSCWPPPEPCTMESCPDKPWQPDYPPGDFGCGDDKGGGTDPGDGNTMPAKDVGK